MAGLEQRVARAVEAALASQGGVSAIDVLVGLGWLAEANVDRWRQGRSEYLELALQVGPEKRDAALAQLARLAEVRGLTPSETAYVSRTRDRRPLRFSRDGDAAVEAAYRTHWLSPALSQAKRERLLERQNRPPELVVVIPLREWACAECRDSGSIALMEDAGPICLACADLDHLVFLAAGEAALTRRARKASGLAAVVVRFSRSRRRYERRGLLVEQAALDRAEAECLADEEARARRRRRDQERRAGEDAAFQAKLGDEILRRFPGCPPARALEIARHTGARGSGRVGRSAAGRALDAQAVRLAVVASVRHADTRYDELLMSGVARADARRRVEGDVEAVLARWRASAGAG